MVNGTANFKFKSDYNVGQSHKSWSAAVYLLLFSLITTVGPIE